MSMVNKNSFWFSSFWNCFFHKETSLILLFLVSQRFLCNVYKIWSVERQIIYLFYCIDRRKLFGMIIWSNSVVKTIPKHKSKANIWFFQCWNFNGENKRKDRVWKKEMRKKLKREIERKKGDKQKIKYCIC